MKLGKEMREIKIEVYDTLDYKVKFNQNNFKNDSEVATHLMAASAILCKEVMNDKQITTLMSHIKELMEESK